MKKTKSLPTGQKSTKPSIIGETAAPESGGFLNKT
jgi:hypothetical protein